MLTQIPIRKLRIGMRIADVGLSRQDYPGLCSEDRIIQSEREVSELLLSGFRDAFADMQGGDRKGGMRDDHPSSLRQAQRPVSPQGVP